MAKIFSEGGAQARHHATEHIDLHPFRLADSSAVAEADPMTCQIGERSVEQSERVADIRAT